MALRYKYSIDRKSLDIDFKSGEGIEIYCSRNYSKDTSTYIL